MSFYQFIISRLNGRDIEKDFANHARLVKNGIAGFIIFGGRLDTVRQGIKELQTIAERPLIIASDLEQGLGQQVEGGTLFPPAMAIALAIKKGNKLQVTSYKLKLLQKIFKAIALEARYAGINTIFAPVLDINTNPENPIIATRSFGEDPETVSFFGCEMIRIFQDNGIAACGKHFPGHGDTEVDSHIKLPVINKGIKSLRNTELLPFRNAIKGGVKMIMLGHLRVPAIDPSGSPASISEKAVRFLREEMRYRGILVTDALNMGAISSYSEEKASLMALEAGVDLLLHPTDPDRIASYLGSKLRLKTKDLELKSRRPEVLTSQFLVPSLRSSIPSFQFEKHRGLSEELTKRAIKIEGSIRQIEKPFLIILNDDADVKGNPLITELKHRHHDARYLRFKTGEEIRLKDISGRQVIVAVFSGIKAWKGGPSSWLFKCIKRLEDRADIFVSFGSPYILDAVNKGTKIYAYWDSESAQKAVAEVF